MSDDVLVPGGAVFMPVGNPGTCDACGSPSTSLGAIASTIPVRHPPGHHSLVVQYGCSLPCIVVLAHRLGSDVAKLHPKATTPPPDTPPRAA